MTMSVVTNPPAFAALRTFNAVGRHLDAVQNRVSTGLKVSGALDDASSFAIAQGIRGELRAIDAVNQGLNNAKGIAKVAIAGATAFSDLMQDIRKKITEGANQGNSTQQQAILQDDYAEMIQQLRQILENSEFNGVNVLIEVAIPYNLAIGSVRDVDVLSNVNGGSLRISGQRLDLYYAQLANEDISTPANALQALTVWQTANDAVGLALGSLGADLRSLELQTTFLESIRDATEEGLGNIVDADLARESADLTAVQVQQQLAAQTLGIANRRPQTVLGLFQ
jgi:flagellin